MSASSVLGWSGGILDDRRQTTWYGTFRGWRRGRALIVDERGFARRLDPRTLFGHARAAMLASIGRGAS